jgi:DNA-binding PadR family transcriptional regulator
VSVRLFVLGALAEGEAHGYDLIEKGKSWGLETWAEISYSSIYHALRTMAAEGLIAEVARERDGGKPERTVYKINAKGRKAFALMMEEAASAAETAKDPLYLVLAFIGKFSASDRMRMMDRRRDMLEAQREAIRGKLTFMEGHPGADYWSKAAVDLNLRRVEAELEWLARLNTYKG